MSLIVRRNIEANMRQALMADAAKHLAGLLDREAEVSVS
jgi:hypothetical protein